MWHHKLRQCWHHSPLLTLVFFFLSLLLVNLWDINTYIFLTIYGQKRQTRWFSSLERKICQSVKWYERFNKLVYSDTYDTLKLIPGLPERSPMVLEQYKTMKLESKNPLFSQIKLKTWFLHTAFGKHIWFFSLAPFMTSEAAEVWMWTDSSLWQMEEWPWTYPCTTKQTHTIILKLPCSREVQCWNTWYCR